jgi:hypothetical protein
MESKYVVVFEDNPQYKGMERFLLAVADVGQLTYCPTLASLYDTKREAEAALQKWAYLQQNRPELLPPKVARMMSENKYRIEE